MELDRQQQDQSVITVQEATLTVKATPLVLLLVFVGVSVSAFAQYRGSTRSANVPVGNVPVGSAPPPSSTVDRTTGDPDTGAAPDPREETIKKTAEQLGLTSDQRTELSSALKADREERAALDKAFQDARRALADSLANGETFLDSQIENVASANAKVQESELKRWAKLYSILTPDQQRRLLSMSTPLSLATASHQVAQRQ